MPGCAVWADVEPDPLWSFRPRRRKTAGSEKVLQTNPCQSPQDIEEIGTVVQGGMTVEDED